DAAVAVPADRLQLLAGGVALQRVKFGGTAIACACEQPVPTRRHPGAHTGLVLRCCHAAVSVCGHPRVGPGEGIGSAASAGATAAIIALAVTIGSWVLDFTVAGQPGLLAWIAKLSLTQTLRPFEQGLLSGGLVLGIAGVIGGFIALASVWLPPGIPPYEKLRRSVLCILAVAAILGAAIQGGWSVDVTEDRRNSFAATDQQLLATLRLPLVI